MLNDRDRSAEGVGPRAEHGARAERSRYVRRCQDARGKARGTLAPPRVVLSPHRFRIAGPGERRPLGPGVAPIAMLKPRRAAVEDQGRPHRQSCGTDKPRTPASATPKQQPTTTSLTRIVRTDAQTSSTAVAATAVAAAAGDCALDSSRQEAVEQGTEEGCKARSLVASREAHASDGAAGWTTPRPSRSPPIETVQRRASEDGQMAWHYSTWPAHPRLRHTRSISR